MTSILLITSIDPLKNRLIDLIKRRYNVFDYSKIIDFDYLASIADSEKLKYLKYVFKKKDIVSVVWLPVGCNNDSIEFKELLSSCTEAENIRSVIFDIKNFISIEGQDSKVFENKISKIDESLKMKCDVKVNVSYLMDTGFSILNNQLKSNSWERYCCDHQVPISLIDDIAEYILQCGEELEISFQLYTKDALRHKLKSGFSLSDCGLGENNSIQAADRVETLLRQSACCLKPVYQLKANDFWRTKRVATFRSELGAKLAKHLSVESINNIDIVVPVPETGKYYAQGLAKVISKPFVEAIFRNQNMGRGLQIEDAAQRNIFIRKKLTVIEELVKGKNVGIVDEAVFTGATLRIVVDQLKDAGANRIHLLLPTPHNVRACEYNVLPQRNVLLDYIRRTDLKDYFDVDEITFASINDLHNSLGNQVCLDCFDC